MSLLRHALHTYRRPRRDGGIAIWRRIGEALTGITVWFMVVVVGIVAGCCLAMIEVMSLRFSKPPLSTKS